MESLWVYVGLFAISFFAATLFPAQSEAVLLGLLVAGDHSPGILLLVASTGNVLGSCMNWLLGVLLARFEGRDWFPIKRSQLARAEAWYHHYGRWSLLLSWLPLIGDPLTVVAGVLREPLSSFLALVSAAKIARYLAIFAIYKGWFS